MALIVKGNMPTCCGLCFECLGGGSEAYYCNRAKRQISEVVPPYDKRMEWCPILGEIPDKHGRLIDTDVIGNWLREQHVFSMPTTCKIDSIIKDMPTVIEASTEEST